MSSWASLAAGATVGRYRIVARLGAGTMGVVYRAHDPQLGRDVALKLIAASRPQLARSLESRLMREAQALARISHPNVIQVFDVGAVDDHVYLAMELIDGDTLKAYLARGPRSDREIVDVFVQAGQGLAAAHAAGLVHRDFKPDNVMIARDGRVRVVDFGLVTPENAGDSEPRLTRAGAPMGTPAYMAPEQHRCEPVDARSDQFSFCVALYEALYRERPFAGSNAIEIALEVLAGKLRSPRGVHMRCRYRRHLVRGLALEPTRRFRSMDDLLAKLRATRRPLARRIGWGVAGALVIGAVIGWAIAPASDRGASCANAAARVHSAWSVAMRSNLARALLASERPYANATYARIASRLDGFAASWSSTAEHACNAPAPALRTFDCLDRRLGELEIVLAAISDSRGAEIADRAIASAGRLGDPRRCHDLDGDEPPAWMQLPAAAGQRATTEAITLMAAGRYSAAISVARGAVAAAAAFPQARGEASLALGTALVASDDLDGGERALRAAVRDATVAHDGATAARAWISLIELVGVARGRVGEAELIANYAELAVGNDDELAAELAQALGRLASASGDYPVARAHHARALAIREQRFGSDDVRVATSLSEIGEALRHLGRHDAALAHHRRAYKVMASALGDGHPDSARALERMGGELIAVGQLDEAATALDRALAIYRSLLGERSSPVAHATNLLGHLAVDRGDLVAAKQRYGEVLAIARELYGGEHPEVAAAYNNLGNVAELAGELDTALRYYQRALEIKVGHYGANHPETAVPLYNVGSALVRAGRFDRAEPRLREALAIWRTTLGANHDYVATALEDLGAVAIAQRNWPRALAQLEEAVAIWRGQAAPPHRIAVAQALLAEALWRARRHQPALELAAIARAALMAADSANRDVARARARLDGWLGIRSR